MSFPATIFYEVVSVKEFVERSLVMRKAPTQRADSSAVRLVMMLGDLPTPHAIGYVERFHENKHSGGRAQRSPLRKVPGRGAF